VLRRADAPTLSAASFTVDLPGTATRPGSTVAERIEAAAAEAYQRGVADGRAAAEAALAASAETERRRRLADLARTVAAGVEVVAAARREAVAIAELEVAQLAVELAAVVVGRELRATTIGGVAGGGAVAGDAGAAAGARPGAVVDALHRALGLVPEGADLIIRLHPDDVVAAAELPALVAEQAGVVGQVQVVSDEHVESGGCVVDAGPCRIDAQIGPALDRARQLLGLQSAPSVITGEPGR
jgi:flagellar assembly protein FliH